MSLFRVDPLNQQLTRERPTSFAQQGLRERQDLQPLLRNQPDAIDPDLMIIAEEFGSWEGSARRIDLLGLDGQGNLVVIELKRVEDGGHVELQALRYAAMVSSMDFEGVVRTCEAFLTKRGKRAEVARQKLREFLGPDPVITQTPRLVLLDRHS